MWRKTGLMGRGYSVWVQLALLLGLCVFLLVIRSMDGLSGIKQRFLCKDITPMYDDVNVDCLRKCHLNYGDIVETHQREEREVDVSDWDADKICKLTEEESEYDRVVFDNILSSGVPGDADLRIAYVTHFSYDRLDKFLAVVQHWPGFISAAVHIKAEMVEEFVNNYCRKPELAARDNIGVHLVIQKGIFYPYNYYRNIALERAPTSHVFVTDIDLVPSDDLERRSLQHFKEHKVGEKQVLVVPSFEITKEQGYTVPRSKEDLLRIWDQGELQAFYATRYAPAYMPLNYTIWRTAVEPYWVKYFDQFEPYVIAEKTKLQPYTNRFVGRFYNKATHLAELHCRGYEFIVAPDVFNVHIPHESIHEKAFEAYFRCLYRLYEAFKVHLETTYSLKMPPKAPLKPDGT